ncbi:TPM domain-containing protein [Salinisphaera hydrothermalis]|uniref:TPM domain-containing protein n=1 Tax=Salinisphaera hydrothermalis TaxID=563188 RepID=UPI003341FB9E
MTVFNERARQAVADAVTRIERDTDAEVVTVLAQQADEYRWIGLFWAALVALMLPGLVIFFPAWFDVRTLLLLQWGVFVVLGVIFQLPAVTPRLVPKGLRYARAAALARSQFLEQNLHRTAAATGVLIFVAEVERYVEILTDHGVAERIDNAAWSAIIERFTARVAAGETEAGFVECVEACGARLAEAVPATHERNELPNRLVVLE